MRKRLIQLVVAALVLAGPIAAHAAALAVTNSGPASSCCPYCPF